MSAATGSNELHRELNALKRELEAKRARRAEAQRKRDELRNSELQDSEKNESEIDGVSHLDARTLKVYKLIERKAKAVTSEEVSAIFYRMQIRFRVLRIPLSSIIKHFQDIATNDHVQILRVADMLGRRPFELKKPADIALVSRFLVEDNTKNDKSETDMNLTTPLVHMLSIVRHMLGNYQLIPEDQLDGIRWRLKASFALSLPRVVDCFCHHTLRNNGDGTTNVRRLVEIVRESGVVLEPEDMDYIIMHLYTKTRDLEKLQVFAILDHLELQYQIAK